MHTQKNKNAHDNKIMASIFKYKNGWRIQAIINQKRISKVFKTKSECFRWIQEQKDNSDISTISFKNVIEIYKQKVASKKITEKTFIIRCNLLAKQKFAEKNISSISTKDIAEFRDERLKIVGSATVLKDLSILSNIFKYSINEWGFCKENPVSKIKKPTPPKHRERRITNEEINLILQALDFQKTKEIKNKRQLIAAFFLLAIETAMRLGEIASLDAENIDFDKKVAYLLKTKNGDERHIPLSSKAVDLLRLIINSELKSTSSQASAIFRKYTNSLINNLTFHDTRHEAISRLAKVFTPLELAKTSGRISYLVSLPFVNSSIAMQC